MPAQAAAPRFRRAGTRDVAAVLRLVRGYYAFDGLPFDAAHTRAMVRRLLARPALGEIWLIRAGRATAGYLVLTSCFSLEFGGEVFLDEFYLRAAYRGRGLGRAALDFVAGWARRHGKAVVHVISERHNPAARRVYRAAGFGTAHRYLMTRTVLPRPAARLPQK